MHCGVYCTARDIECGLKTIEPDLNTAALPTVVICERVHSVLDNGIPSP